MLPEDESLAAFSDRFLLHLFVEPIPDNLLESMLVGGWESGRNPVTVQASLEHIDTLSQAVPAVRLEQARPLLAAAIRSLRSAGIALSDRRIVKLQRLIGAAAVLSGRMVAGSSDLWPIFYALPTAELQQRAREVLREQLAEAASASMFSSVEEAALQPMSRAARLLDSTILLLARLEAAEASAQNLLLGDIESLLREIDANFSQENMPSSLAGSRAQLARYHHDLLLVS